MAGTRRCSVTIGRRTRSAILLHALARGERVVARTGTSWSRTWPAHRCARGWPSRCLRRRRLFGRRRRLDELLRLGWGGGFDRLNRRLSGRLRGRLSFRLLRCSLFGGGGLGALLRQLVAVLFLEAADDRRLDSRRRRLHVFTHVGQRRQDDLAGHSELFGELVNSYSHSSPSGWPAPEGCRPLLDVQAHLNELIVRS